MHDAKRTMLSKIKVGDTILVAPGKTKMSFEFGRPKDRTATPLKVTQLHTKPDQWTGKVYTVQVTGGQRNEGRYGTTHVYVAAEQPDEQVRQDVAGSELDLDLTVSGTRRVRVEPDGTMRVKDWTGGEVTERTPKGRLVRIAADGLLTILEDFPEEDEAPAPKPAVTDEEVLNSDRCHQCKGFGVVRKRGSQAGKPYRTLAGAEAATDNGNSEKCPVCKGAALVLRNSA